MYIPKYKDVIIHVKLGNLCVRHYKRDAVQKILLIM